jgi:hypothetical protein
VTDYGDDGSLHALRDTRVEIDRFRALAR